MTTATDPAAAAPPAGTPATESPAAGAAPTASPPQYPAPASPPRNAAASATLPGASPMEQTDRNEPIQWLITPHLIEKSIVCSGVLRDGARISDVMNGESAAFSIYRHNPDLPPDQRFYPVIVIVPRRSDGRAWPAQMANGAQVIAAEQYVVSGHDFMFLADIGSLLPDNERHLLTVTGTIPGDDRRALGRQDIHRYIHSRLPRRSLASLLGRSAGRAMRKVLRWLKATWKLLLILAAIVVGVVVVAFAAIGFVVAMDPELIGLEIIDKAEWILRWLPWHQEPAP